MILVIDIGTSSMRSMIIDDNGAILEKCQKEYSLDIISDTEIEINPQIVKDSVADTFKELSTIINKNNYKIEAISLTAQRSSVIAVDKNGCKLHNAIMWQDVRTRDICKELSPFEDEVFSICGMKITTTFSATKMLYYKRHLKDIYDKAYKLIGFQEYILHFLTNEFVTDTSIASRTLLFDIQKLEWSNRLLDIFEIDKDKLCTIADVGSVVSNATDEVKALLGTDYDIPVVSAGGDQQCASLGLGCILEGDATANSGTGSYIIALSDKAIFDKEKRINCNVSAIPDKWILEGTVLGAGKVMDWFKTEFFGGDVKAFDRACENTDLGSNGVIISPSFVGKGTPTWNANAKGGIWGLSLNNTKNDFARALLEGISSDMADCLKLVDEIADTPINNVKIAGGLTKNEVYNQIQCDMYEKTVIKPQVAEATALGAFISAKKAISDKSYAEIINEIETNPKIYQPIKENSNLYSEINKKRQKFY